MTATKQPNGLTLWTGPSLLDGSPIALIAIGLGRGSSNGKTGDMLQTYILRTDMLPTEAVKTGADAAICGDCKHRPSTGGACYVNVGQGPQIVYRAWARGGYPVAQDDSAIIQAGAGRMVRLGTYGDPAAVPADVWALLLLDAQGRTGYTHQWVQGRADALQDVVMASADSDAERARAVAQGWRTFRVRTDAQAVMPGEFICPASEEAGKRKTCAECGACDGAQRGAQKASPVIISHGAKARRFIAISAAL